VWQSMRPGRTVFCDRSITSAPGGMASPGPTAVIRSSAIKITALATGAPPRPSISRPARTATRWGGWGGTGGAAPRRTRARAKKERIGRPRFMGTSRAWGRGLYRGMLSKMAGLRENEARGVAVVTGGGSGLGREIALELARRG